MRLDWKWIALGSVVITGTQWVILRVGWRLAYGEDGAVLASLMADGLESGALWLTVGMLALGYVAGGVLVGRMSAGRTVLEPALASTVPIVFFVTQFLARSRSEFVGGPRSTLTLAALALAGAVPCFALALLGGWLGEKWQERAEA